MLLPSNEVKILGITLSNHHHKNKINFGPHVNSLINKVTRFKNTLFFFCGSTWGLDSRKRLIIFKLAIRPIIAYEAEIWYPYITKAKKAKIDSLQYQIILQCMMHRTTSSYTSHLLAEILTINDYLEFKLTKFIILLNSTDKIIAKAIIQQKKEHIKSKLSFYLSKTSSNFKKFFPRRDT